MRLHAACRVGALSVAAGVALSACSGPPSRAAAPVQIWSDGLFDDWRGVPAAVIDSAGDAGEGSAVDLGAVHLHDDPQFLHVLAEMGDTVTILAMPGTLEVVMEIDGDPGTGNSYGGVEGADLVVVLSRLWGNGGSWGAGVGVRRLGGDDPESVESASSVGLLVAPTHSSDRFEVRLDRRALADWSGIETPAAGDSIAVRLRFLALDSVADETETFHYRLATSPGADPPLLSAKSVDRTPGTLRVVAWNVADGGFRDRRPAFERVVRGLNPDVVLLDEVHADVTMSELERFGDSLGEESGPEWRWWLAQGGGRQRTVVGARGLQLLGDPSLARIAHEPGALERWLERAGNEPEYPGMPPPSMLARAEAEGGLSATGAWVAWGGLEILFAPVDLQSAGYDGSPRDRLRELQARTLNRALAAALADRPGAGLVVAGDLNLVGSARPLEELRASLEAGGGNLQVARVERLRDRSLATWRSMDPRAPFSPGRLDYVLYRGAMLSLERAFIFDAEDLSAEALTLLGIHASDSRASDHLPLVADFSLRRPASEAPLTAN
ncbi:MAG: endonuclease/exonuclease/phosphatase family protein [Gemmatimonadetes bacterium]|nr:endonuclease/exonuclease/phosphatase family protein [Gemmatimonadota bacterium]